jgi:hypothetical protein
MKDIWQGGKKLKSTCQCAIKVYLLVVSCYESLVFIADHLVVFSSKQLYTHDGKYEPEDEAHQKHIEDTGDSLHQGIHHHL